MNHTLEETSSAELGRLAERDCLVSFHINSQTSWNHSPGLIWSEARWLILLIEKTSVYTNVLVYCAWRPSVWAAASTGIMKGMNNLFFSFESQQQIEDSCFIVPISSPALTLKTKNYRQTRDRTVLSLILNTYFPLYGSEWNQKTIFLSNWLKWCN